MGRTSKGKKKGKERKEKNEWRGEKKGKKSRVSKYVQGSMCLPKSQKENKNTLNDSNGSISPSLL